MSEQNVLQAGADEKILLLEAKLFSLRGRIIGIQHPGEIFRLYLIMHGGRVIAGIKGFDPKWRDSPAGPQPQVIDGGAAVPENQLIESNGVDVLGVDPSM